MPILRRVAYDSLTDEELAERVRIVQRDEDAVSYRRRLLHGRIDVVRAEVLARIGESPGDGENLDDLLARLKQAFDHTGPPPLDQELERLGADVDDSAVAAANELDALPDLTALDDLELHTLARSLAIAEQTTSAERQRLHVELDELRGERVRRLRDRYGSAATDED